jgi:PAS domain S-box-containing protein
MSTFLEGLKPAQAIGTVSPDTLLPAAPAQLQAGMAAVYHAAVSGTPRRELLQMICVELARRLALPLVMIARKAPNGAVLQEAASSENALYVAFHRIPECWDGGVAGRGPASEALRAGSPVRLSFTHEALAFWSAAAQQEGIAEVLAWPLAHPDQHYVIELFTRAGPGPVTGTSIGAVTQGLCALLADLDRIERQRLISGALEAAGNAAFVTDAHGTILWSNPAFSALTGYAADEVRGRNPSLLHSGKQGVRYYRDLWSTIRSGKAWSGETVDCDKNGALYTVRQTVSPVLQDGRVTHYVSIHEDISLRKRQQKALELATGVDQRTGLLTQAAFEASARDALATVSARQNGLDLILISLRGLRRAAESFDVNVEEFLADTMGRRVREVIPAPHLAAMTGNFEYAALVVDDQRAGATVEQLVDDLQRRLGEPVLYLGNSLEVDLRCVRAHFPTDGDSFEQVLAKADRKLADEPLARVRTH